MTEHEQTCHEGVATDERRARVRYATSLPTLCQTSTAQMHDFWLLGKIQDLSANGIRLHLNRPFEPGSVVVIEPTKTQSVAHMPQARVIYSLRDKRGWILGCEFLEPLRPEDIKSLL